MANIQPDSANDRQQLVLRTTKLMCHDDVVAKYDRMAMITAEYPLRSIVDVRVESVTEWTIPAVVIAFFAASGWASWNFIPNPTVSMLVTWTCIGTCIFCLFGIRSTRIVFETLQGTVRFTAQEPIEEVRAFALAVKLRTVAETLVGRWRSETGDSTILIEFEGGTTEGIYKQVVQLGETVVREFGHWYHHGKHLFLLMMATDIRQNPRFGIDTSYEVAFLDVDHLRIHGPDRENWKLARTSMQPTGFEDFHERRDADERLLTSKPASSGSATSMQP